MGGRQLGFNESRDLLAEYEIPILGEEVLGVEEMKAAAETLGFPIVLKGIASGIIHKTDVGVVFLDIREESDAVAAYETILKNTESAGAEIEAVLVQTMAKRGFELIIGAQQDPCFGPVTMVGHGGRFVELFEDVAPGVGPLEPDDVYRMLSRTKAGRILDGFRGPALDTEAVVELTIKVSRFMLDHPEINELDLNPVIVYEKGFAIVDARLIQGAPVAHPRDQDLSPKRMKSLGAVFNPRSVAVVGASRPGTIGGIILKNSSRVDNLYPVNPRYDSLLGRRCYPSLKQLPEVPDVGVFAVNPERTIENFEAFCKMGGRGAVVVSDGFAEIGRNDLEEKLVGISNEHDVIYIGPNGLGVIDNYSGLNTLFIPEQRTASLRRPGGLGVISQSGGIGLELLEMLEADNLSVGRWVSCGNASGIAISELLAHLGDDPKIKLIALYLEGLTNGLQFMEVGRRVSQHKPVIAIKGGMGGGAAATMSHTASLAGSAQAFKACCEQAGIYLLEELTEDPKLLINLISILATQPRAMGKRVAVVSVGGGAAILLADQVTEHHLELASFAPETVKAFQELLGGKIQSMSEAERDRIIGRLGSNPVDLFGDCDDDRLLEALRILDADPGTDIILTALYYQVPYLSEYLLERLVELKKELSKPLILSPRGFSDHVFRSREYLYANNFHTYTVPMILPLAIATDIWKRYGTDFIEPTGETR
jgi:3-hydroxypropionyl-CoA synthetase (ADP-forming)